MLKPVDYDRQQHQVYAKGRALSAQVMADWMATFGAHLPARRPLRLLDLGSGTGRFSPALAETFGGPVIGVEPSERMRAAAEVGAIHPSVRYVAGEAGAIPLEDASVDGVLMFLSFHHVKDKPAAAREVIERPFEGTLKAQAEKLKLKAISIFEHLTEAEWANGCAAMDAALATGDVATPGTARVDLLVLSAS